MLLQEYLVKLVSDLYQQYLQVLAISVVACSCPRLLDALEVWLLL
jgi:hypothetical protein